MSNRFVVIMAGGRGERFWPQSRLHRPKHLLPIVGTTPMLAQTIERVGATVPRENIAVITNLEQLKAVREVCPGLPPENIIGEPVGRDTAPAVGLARELIAARNPHATVAMLPADAAIHDAAGFQRALTAAFEAAESEPVIVTIGIEPTHPATGYGYIEKGPKWQAFQSLQGFRVERFVEKPNSETAEGYLRSGRYFWNAGMFIFSVSTMAEQFRRHAPSLNRALEQIGQGLKSGEDTSSLLQRLYPSLEKISVDYAIMEPSSKEGVIVTLPSCFDWDDVGEWPAIARHCPQDAHGNVVRGNGVVQQGKNNIIASHDGHLIALLGCEDLIVVTTPDATLVCPRNRAQELKSLVKQVTSDPASRHLL